MLRLNKFGIAFNYKGDEVIYVFPWKRERFNWRFFSVSFMGYFSTLKAIDDEWEEYNRALYHMDGVKVVRW